MRSKLSILAVALVSMALLSACGPAAKALQGISTAGSGSVPVNAAEPRSLPAVQSTAGSAQTQPAVPPVRTISVTGEGRATLTPDIAYVNIGVHTESADVGEALATNKIQVQKVVDALKALGIAEKDIQTTNFNVYPSQQYGPNGELLQTKFVVDNSVYVTVRNLDQLGDLLDKAVEAGANNINGIQFDVADKTAALSDARKAAVKDAQALAQELAGAAGVALGPIQNISTYSNNVPMPVYADKAFGMGGGGAPAPAVAVPVSPGQMILTVSVSMTYEIQ